MSLLTNNTATNVYINTKDKIHKLEMFKSQGGDLTSAKAQKMIEDLLELRGRLNEEMQATLKTVKTIEEGIKGLHLPEGKYGKGFSLRVVRVNKEPEIDLEKAAVMIKEQKWDLLRFSTLDPKNEELQALAKENPNLLVTDQKITYRHNFSK